MNGTRFERRILITLSLMLVCVFLMSVHMYDTIEEGTNDGALAVFAEAAREFVYENDSVATFLGIEETTACEEERQDTYEQALAYIKRYNQVYGNS